MSDAVARVRNALGVVVGSAAFAAAWWRAREPDVTDAEERVMRVVNRGPEVVYRPVYLVMQLGSLGGGLAAGALLARRDRRTGIATMLAVTAAWGGSKLVKRSTGRGRPEAHLDEIVIRGAPQRGLGFPSGHAGVATVVALAAAPVLPRPAAVVVAGAAITTVLARVYVGAHLPLDVAGGAAMGFALGCAAREAAGLRSR
jgi:glycosyltransferase 2 family protein